VTLESLRVHSAKPRGSLAASAGLPAGTTGCPPRCTSSRPPISPPRARSVIQGAVNCQGCALAFRKSARHERWLDHVRLPVRLDRAPQRGAAFAIPNASRRARMRSIGSRSRARGSSLILPIPPAVAPPPPPGPTRYLGTTCTSRCANAGQVTHRLKMSTGGQSGHSGGRVTGHSVM
jgi:hypothetical protein